MKKQKAFLSLGACRKLLPIVSAGKYIAILCAIFFQQDTTPVPLVICASAAMLFICLDTVLKLSVWKCPRCHKPLPHDFYSRKTITKCPSCGEALDFSRDGSALPGDGSSGT
jgi:rubrerythrin